MLASLNSSWYEEIHNRYYPKMIKVEGGRFWMNDDFQVEVSDYEIAATETTIWQYNLYCEATGEDSMARIKPEVSWGLDGDNPMIYVNWYDGARYANWVSKQLEDKDAIYELSGEEQLDTIHYEKSGYRLPTEAEWEYPASGGKDGYDIAGKRKYTYAGTSNEDSLGFYAWYKQNSGRRTRATGVKLPNDLGIYDMSGNVWEWFQDWFDDYQIYDSDSVLIYADSMKVVVNPKGDISREHARVMRGGSWVSYASDMRVADRFANYPKLRRNIFGFPLLRIP